MLGGMTSSPTVLLAFLLAVPLHAAEPARGSAPAGTGAKFRVRTKSSATMGVRGLDEVTLKEAAPNAEELAKLDSYAQDAGGLAGFETHRGQRLIPIVLSGTQRPETDEVERQTGRELAARLLGAAPLAANAGVQRYVNRVGSWIALRSDRPALAWRFGVLDSPSLNAFALPGGIVLITRGLYEKLRSESELAAVLAHEIAHVVAGHHYGLLVVQKGLEAAKNAVSKVRLSKKVLESLIRQQMAQGLEIYSKALDRGAELEADQHALLLSADAGYEPFGLTRVFQVLSGVHSGAAGAKELLFRTHPSPDARLDSARAALGSGRLAALNAGASRPDFGARFSENRF